MEKRKIVIVECISSSINYIMDAYDEGYEPIILEPYCNAVERLYWRLFHNHELDVMLEKGYSRPKKILAKKTYQNTLEQVKELNPIAIIPGSDRGIELATQLAFDLDLCTNNPDNLPKMRNKYVAQESLKRAGIRYIDSIITADYEEAVLFFTKKKQKNKMVVVKPISGISSLGVYICKTEEELKRAFYENQKNIIYTRYNGSERNKVLLQECINGREYVVNSVSCNGKHRITSASVHTKRRHPDYGTIYDYAENVLTTDPILLELANYQMQVLDAIGITVGPVHSEIMVDDEGPVLIEANCRLCGGNYNRNYLSSVFGISDSMVAIKSYLNRDLFQDDSTVVMYEDKGFMIRKDLILNKTTYIKRMRINEVFERIPSFKYSVIKKTKGFFSETINLQTSIGALFYVCSSKPQAENVLKTILDFENNHPEEIYDCINVPILCKLMAKLFS